MVLTVLGLTGDEWRTVGAIAGPILALVSLLWQALEKRGRPQLEQRSSVHAWRPRRDQPEWTAQVIFHIRVINPRPSSLIIMNRQVRAKRRWRPFGELLAEDKTFVQVPSEGEEQTELRCYGYTEPRTLRVVVRGRRFRRLRSPWEEVGSAELERAASGAEF